MTPINPTELGYVKEKEKEKLLKVYFLKYNVTDNT